jgi:hypothetical protein
VVSNASSKLGDGSSGERERLLDDNDDASEEREPASYNVVDGKVGLDGPIPGDVDGEGDDVMVVYDEEQMH